MSFEDFLRSELKSRIAEAGRRRFGESPLEGAPRSPVSTAQLDLKGPADAFTEFLNETMAVLGLAWCGHGGFGPEPCEAWTAFCSKPIGDTGDYGTYCRVCGGDVEDPDIDAAAIYSAIPILRRALSATRNDPIDG